MMHLAHLCVLTAVSLQLINFSTGETLAAQPIQVKLFPHGSRHGDNKLSNDLDDTSSSEFHLKVPISFYEKLFNSIYINSNGLLSFLTDIPNFFNIQFPLDYPVIAPFYSDIDTRGNGAVFYRESQAADLLEEVTQKIRKHFSTGINFKASSVLIVTWDHVGYYNAKSDKVNTFQVAIASDGQQSFIFFLYSDIQWIHGEGKISTHPDARAQAGLMSGEGHVHLLVNSGRDQIRNIYRISNVGERGLWMFRIGKTPPGANVQEPDMNLGEAVATVNTPQSCVIGAAFCHSHGKCVDHSPGFCCACSTGYYGNGKNCLENGVPQRLNGKVTGTLNEERIEDSDLHAYVVTSEGRAYTAISRISDTLGYDMQLLLPLGGIIGWMFALPQGKALNGYMITDGIFNHTVEVKFPQSGHQVKIQQNFLGLDVFNHLHLTTDIQGKLPTIPLEGKIEIEDYEEEYTKTSPGVIRSHGKRNYRLENSHISNPFTVDETITYDECLYGPVDPDFATLRLKVARNYIVYDPREQVIRYSVTNKMFPLTIEDPCKEGAQHCGEFSSCVVDGDTYRCECDPGYEILYHPGAYEEESVCIDTNECASGRSNCHSFADCINQPGSFICRCQPGYIGDGITCSTPVHSCDELQCPETAVCIQDSDLKPRCICASGFVGDGYNCVPAEPTTINACADADICDPNADCVFDPKYDTHICKCLEGYTGDGVNCIDELESCDIEENCHEQASCLFDPSAEAFRCVCNFGYQGNGYQCIPEVPIEISCNVINNCHPDALCVYNVNQRNYECQCNAGYEGDGITCTVIDVSCDEVNLCSIYATCIYDSVLEQHVCRCNENYVGDGKNCLPVDDCKTEEDCSENAECIFDSISQRYSCQCSYGFVAEGGECVLTTGASCHVLNNCDVNAQCIYDTTSLQYHCLCNSGYQGDGYTCAKAVVACNIHNNCHPNADCEYDNVDHGHRCHCHEGYIGDGLNCIPAKSCLNDPSLCHENAECIRHPVLEHHLCQCQQGFNGDGQTCTAIPSHDGNFLLVNQGMATVRLPISADIKENGKPVVLIPHQTALGIDVDCTLGMFYWTDIAGGSIKKASYDGSDVETFLDKNLVSPECIAVDWVSRNVFWTDSGKDTIEVAKLETQERKVLFDKNLANPRGIAVHPGRGKVYWSDWERTAPKIESASMDGTARDIFIGDNLGLPNSLTIDFERDDLCWADAGMQKIECIGLNGSNRRTVIAPVAYPFGLTNNRETMFWTDWDAKAIHSASKVAYNLNKPITSPLGGNSKLYGIVVVPERCPRVSNPCAVSNGGCRYLCLPNGHGGRTCVCPDYGDNEEIAACNEIS